MAEHLTQFYEDKFVNEMACGRGVIFVQATKKPELPAAQETLLESSSSESEQQPSDEEVNVPASPTPPPESEPPEPEQPVVEEPLKPVEPEPAPV